MNPCFKNLTASFGKFCSCPWASCRNIRIKTRYMAPYQERAGRVPLVRSAQDWFPPVGDGEKPILTVMPVASTLDTASRWPVHL
jgi:hypothetical protein